VNTRLVRTAVIAAGIAAIAALAVKEYPSVRREIKIWLM
jgi:hypothetical protein